jgi:hypothetical protein
VSFAGMQMVVPLFLMLGGVLLFPMLRYEPGRPQNPAIHGVTPTGRHITSLPKHVVVMQVPTYLAQLAASSRV